jgi:hypothetical protein
MTDEMWEKLGIEEKLTAIMRELRFENERLYGLPFFTSYQLAIEFASRYK